VSLAQRTQTTEAVLDKSRRSDRFRPEIEGLRAVAILLIVAYHAQVPGISGGFIGVDVFFVLSGYLITGHLVREAETSGRIRFGAFYARRVRRLVPGLGLMVVATLIASALIVAPFDMQELSKEGISAGLYVSNILFAQTSQNYFAPSVTNSPFLHTWSLGVEEQFYLVWPALLLAGVVIARRRLPRVRQAAIVLLAIVALVSFVINVRWTGDGSSWAFFSLPSRAWEFATGGLVALLVGSKTLKTVQRELVRYTSCLLLVLATLLFSDSTSFPGANALLPVLAAAGILAAGGTNTTADRSLISRALCARPMQSIGGVSYAWYLWHWPFIVLAVLAFPSGGTTLRVFAAGCSLLVAYATSRYVENPFRFSERLRSSVRLTFASGLLVTAVVVGVGMATWGYAVLSNPPSFAQQLGRAGQNFFPNCTYLYSPEGARYCIGGDVRAATTVALVGDSHAGTWFNAMSDVSRTLHVRLMLVAEPGCPFIDVTLKVPPNGPVSASQCARLRQAGMRFIERTKPTAVVLTQHEDVGTIENDSGAIPSVHQQALLWKRAFASFLDEMSRQGIRVGVILDNPTLPYEPAECVTRTGSVSDCEPTRAVALAPSQPLEKVEHEVMAQRNVPNFSPDNFLCNGAGCPLELNGQLLYADTNHLYYTATKMMEPQVLELLRTLVPT